MALMLALARRVIPGHQGVFDASYRKRGLEPATTSEWHFSFNWLGFSDVSELSGKTLGLVGLGEIGREVARRARAFDMQILYHQRHPIPEPYERLLAASHVPLERLLRESDFISLHIPHTPETERLLDAKNLALMKPTAYLINTARGGVVDEKALVENLRQRKLAGAGLDVFVEEPLPADHPFLGLDNVVLAPHTGGGSGGGHRKNIAEIINNIARAARGERPRNLVKPEI
jgi:phosphoglycerate dehydrogenase-like enzyme